MSARRGGVLQYSFNTVDVGCGERLLYVAMADAGSMADADEDASYKAWKVERRQATAAFDIEVWYESLAPLTFQTAFVPIDPAEAEACITMYGASFLNRRKATADEVRRVKDLEEKLRTAMAAMAEDAGFFVRLSTRSPKDAAMPSMQAYESEAARRTHEDEPADIDGAVNAKMRAFFEVGVQALRVRDASAAMDLLLSSERVSRDLHDAAAAGVLGEMKVAIRRWEAGLRQEYEFRAFVRAGVLTAITQYNPYCFYPEQVAARDELLATVHTFWKEHIAPAVAQSYVDYVVDVAILADGACRVIELNPFERQTGGGLFNWHDPTDKALLESGPLSLRLATRPPPNLQATLEVFVNELPCEGEFHAYRR